MAGVAGQARSQARLLNGVTVDAFFNQLHNATRVRPHNSS
jgi:hypothetical protein